jgi:hypothetical protein
MSHGKADPMSAPNRNTRNGFLRHFRDLLREAEPCADVDLRGSLRLGKATIRLPPPSLPLQILLGGEQGYRLHLYPEPVLDAQGHAGHRGGYLLIDPLSYFSDISGFMRLSEGDSLTLGREDQMQRLLLRYPRIVDQRHLRLKLSAKGLDIKNKSRKTAACVAPLTAEDLTERLSRWRRVQFARLARALGGPIEPLARAPAMALIEQVGALMEKEPYRATNTAGRYGGLLLLPDRVSPIFVGDLRARIDNLLVILTQNGFMQALEEGSAILILLGSAVHPERPEQAGEMESSMLMMDLIFRLKLRFPDRVFYLRGHHDSFSGRISNAGLPQGLLWEQALHQARGSRYRDAMQKLYNRLPYVAVSKHYLAAHAGAPIGAANWQSLIDIDERPELTHQVTHGGPTAAGDGQRELSRLFRRLGLASNAVCVLGSRSRPKQSACDTGTGGQGHPYRLFSADPEWVGTLTRPRRRLLPLCYPAEPLLAVYNRFARTGHLDE